MAEPKTKADRIHRLLPWLWHWTIEDERLGGFRSDAYAVKTPDGVVVIDALPLTDSAMAELRDVRAVVMTHANHQRAVWRFRAELGAPVVAPSDARGLDEEPDARMDDGTTVPGGLRAIRARGFDQACYLELVHEDSTGVLFCGDLICHDPGGPYRFPDQPEYFDPTRGREDAERLLALPFDALCPAHAAPVLNDGRAALEGALRRAAAGDRPA